MKTLQHTVPCAVLRGGTSRGVYFLQSDLPAEESARDSLLLAVMGGPDRLQVDGIGGGHPLTNKVAIINRSARADADIDYLFLQVLAQERQVSAAQNCGNILAGTGPFAIETGLVDATDPLTTVRVHMQNSGSLAELTIETPGCIINYEGDTAVDGVPGTAAPVICDFLDIAGSTCGALLPTGNVVDTIDGVRLTCIDNGMPVVVLRADDFAISGYETPDELDANDTLREKLERLRLEVGPLMNLGDVTHKSVPKMCLVAAARFAGNISTRTFIPHVCHKSVGVLGAVTVATACLLPGSITEGISNLPAGGAGNVLVEHPGGSFAVRLLVADNKSGTIDIERAGVIRTARMLFRGNVHVPRNLAP